MSDMVKILNSLQTLRQDIRSDGNGLAEGTIDLGDLHEHLESYDVLISSLIDILLREV